MGIFELIVSVTAIGTVGGVVSEWIKYRSKIMEANIKARHKQGDLSLQPSLEALREEVRQLRETTMQYDISFDTALERMERRVEHLERRANAPAVPTEPNSELRIGR